MRYETYTYDDELEGFLPVLARSEAIATRYENLDADFATGKTGAIRKLVKIFSPGYFAGSIPGSTKARILPRMTTVAATALNGTSVTFKPNTSGIFIAGDVLSIIPPSARISITGTWANADSVTVTIAGIPITYGVVTADIGTAAATTLNIANKIISAINANPYLSRLVSALPVAAPSNGADIVLWSKDFTSLYSLLATRTAAGNGNAVASAATFAPNTTVGTISSVNTVTDVVTISAAAVSVPLGMPLGVSASSPENLGLLSPAIAIDLLYRESQNYGLYVDTDVYLNRLPYIDGQLTALYPQINLV